LELKNNEQEEEAREANTSRFTTGIRAGFTLELGNTYLPRDISPGIVRPLKY
jgi:hypothetical protein